MSNSQPVTIITGASAGIGLATAHRLAADGHNLLLTARRQQRLTNLLADLKSTPGHHTILAGDIGDETFCQQLINHTLTTYGHLDILINNAGVGHRSHLANLAPADARHLLNTNLLGPLYLCHFAIPHLQQRPRPQIINISSIISQRPMPNGAFYTASKTALNHLSRGLRIELAHTNICVTTVYPGLTATEFHTATLSATNNNPRMKYRTPASRVAHKIALAIRYQQQEVYITPFDWLFTHLNRLFPRTLDFVFRYYTP
ncbi:MAG TPA: SDR family oxidoreductase [Anaerolineae bacterium]|nr:SDR family oxidoreductase [Anaerolineae bacterium]